MQPHRPRHPLLVLLTGLIVALASPGAATARPVKVVGPGDSIQAAVDAARPGDTILVFGTHRENVAIQTDGVTVRGRGALLLPPATPAPHACFDPTQPGEAVHGICVIGDVDFETGTVSRYVAGVTIAGLTVRGFPGAGLVAVGASDTAFRHNVVASSRDGITSSNSIRTRLRANDVHGGGFGVRLFGSVDATVAGNSLHDNCVGALVLGSPLEAARGARIVRNRVRHNTRACPPDADFPALSGIGVGLVGAVDTTVTRNRITGNAAGGESAAAGGVVALSAPDGTALTGNRVRRNVLRDNEPDLFWDGSGAGNVLAPNVCRTSDPPGLCRPAATYAVDVRRVSVPSPFRGGCPGAAFDATMIPGQELEPSIAAQGRTLVASWKQDVGPDSSRSDVIASSRDGGRNWTRTTIPGLSKCTGGTADGASDPWVSVGPDRTTYFTGLAPYFEGDRPSSAVVAARSPDGGRTWRRPVTLVPPAEGNETPAITASPTRRGRAYEVWAEFASGAVMFSKTNDHGATWSAARVVDPAIPNALDVAPRLVVLPDGALVTVFARGEFATGTGRVYATRSVDQGRTWTAPVELFAQPIETFFDPETGEELPQPQFPNVAAGPDGTVYATIEGDRSATAGDIAVSRSRDGGRTWTRVTSPGVGAYAFEPAIAVGRDGTVGISWYDLRNDRPGDAALSGDVWFAASRDGGSSWTQKHVAGPTDLRSGAPAPMNRFGEYQGLAATSRGFAAIFTLAAPFAADGPTDIFVARIVTRRRH